MADSKTLPRLHDLLDALLAHHTKLEDAWLSAEEEAAWKRTPWEWVVPILIADHGLRGVEPDADIDVKFGRLWQFLRLRRAAVEGGVTDDDLEKLSELADIAAELDRLGTPEVVESVLGAVRNKFPGECSGLGLTEMKTAKPVDATPKWTLDELQGPALRVGEELHSSRDGDVPARVMAKEIGKQYKRRPPSMDKLLKTTGWAMYGNKKIAKADPSKPVQGGSFIEAISEDEDMRREVNVERLPDESEEDHQKRLDKECTRMTGISLD